MSTDPISARARTASWRRWLPVGVAGVLLVAGLAWWAMPASMPGVVVQRSDLTRTLQFTARVETRNRVELGVTQTGRVLEVKVREGEAVRRGQSLIVLEQDEARAALAQAEANLAQSRARLSSQQSLALPSAQAAQAQAEATLQAAQAELKRTEALVAQGFFSQSRLDEARRAAEVAQAQRDAARAQWKANAGQGAEQAAARAQALAAEAAVQVARARLDQTTVRAPADGAVLLRAVEPGQIVQAGKALMTVSVAGPTELVASVDERFLSQLQVGQAAKVVADAFPQQPFDARVDRLAPAVNAQSGAVEVTLAVVPPVPAFLREDMTLSIEVVTGVRRGVQVLPLEAVRDVRAVPGGEQGTVMVVEDGRARLRNVKLGLRTLDQIEVLGGLEDGDTVLRDPTVAEGTRVRARQD
ncbi:efflux RND transporter periplasmic adaptor subunit [Aquabacterium fontiphilum]|uniref:efflux RND transporter periplasmic adaptor subunit n=1 Tax=Aquabacterium fontiphilum TaxID=450365 RepID=UPI001378BC88|nr:efflux RND transporter periplasmic adaptor subunit [Aquabacterium fontiphilum]NBD20875.1 efflux RND transporter periplasmic adaptor subunit [Aquabacterium fontiphilum]